MGQTTIISSKIDYPHTRAKRSPFAFFALPVLGVPSYFVIVDQVIANKNKRNVIKTELFKTIFTSKWLFL